PSSDPPLLRLVRLCGRPPYRLLPAFFAQLTAHCSELSIIVRSCREGIPYEANSYAGAVLCRPDDEAGSGPLFDACLL
ncbi:hypothetical protein FPK83_28645, partial [Acinetobacter baumannii]|nr:hypothetical protein [Acinetobacter baumannii]